MKRLTLTLLLCLLLTLPALAQTPEPTAVATPETTPSETAAPIATQEAPAIVIDTGEGTVTIPVDETPEPDNRVSLTIVEVILMVVGGMITGGAGVGTLAYFIMKDPSRIRLMEKLGDSVPPETAAKIVGVIDVFTPILTLAKEMFDRVPYADKNAIEAGVANAFTAERQRLRENADASATNRALNIVPAPDGPANG
jgi:hypothetical protein